MNQIDSVKPDELFKDILNDFKYVRNINPSLSSFESKKSLLDLIEKLQKFLLTLSGNKANANQTSAKDIDILNAYNDKIFEIVGLIGDLIDHSFSRNQDQYEFYYRYSELIVNITEKSSLKLNYLPNNLNKLTNIFINFSFYLYNESNGSYLQKPNNLAKLSYEVYRALGSLLYQNGSKLNDHNLNRLLNINSSEQNTNLLNKIRSQVEKDLETALKTNHNEETLDLINKLNLISIQLLFNLTIPVSVPSFNSQDESSMEYEFIQDKFKIRCASLLLKSLRFNNNIYLNLNKNKPQASYADKISKHFSNKNNFDDDFSFNLSKAFTKALQSLENLISSIKNEPNHPNWLQFSNTDIQLGDLLAIVKDLCFYGVQNFNRKNPNDEKSHVDKKLEPSNVDEILLPLEKTKKNNELNEENDFNKQNLINNESDDENKNFNSKYSKKSNNPNKKNNYKNAKNSKFSRNNSNQQIMQQSSETRPNINDPNLTLNNNSVQCLRETQVPLVQFKSTMNNYGTDSDVSTDSSLSSSSSFYLEKSNAKVRIASFGILLTIFQRLDKRTVISYWDSFLGYGNNNLIYSVKNDTSPKVRLIAATALTVYLECARSFFTIAAAEDSNSTQILFSNSQTISNSQSFLPISFTISSIIRQLHKDLFISLYQRETFQINQIQLLKCLQCLIKATPYQKLRPGLIYKLILSLNMLLSIKKTNPNQKPNQNKDNILSEILTCLELILTNHHEMAEVHLALLSPINQNTSHFLNQSNLSKNSTMNSSISDDLDLSYKLEKLTTNIKVPNLSQTRVKYFYEAQNSSFSLSNSNTVSGQITPNYPVSDLIQDEFTNQESNKSWLVQFCIKNSNINQAQQFSLECLDLLTIMTKKYFDLFQKDLFFDDICNLILENLENQSNTIDYQLSNQIKQKTLKFLEEFSRCLATDDLRQISSIDLNDCCKFWSNLLNSRLVSEYLIEEQRYLLSSSACDCLASIGAQIFELLPFQKKIFCLTNLLHLTKSQSNLIRAASVRALGVYVTFASLKEDQNYLTDLSICLLNLLANDSNNLVKQKTAWSMSNLSEVLIENADRLGNIFTDEFNLSLWLRLIDSASNSCQRESDKLKSYLVRTLGNLISYISEIDPEEIKNKLNIKTVENSISKAVEVLCMCKNVKMLKVKWNLSHAIGVSMRKFNTWSLHLNNPKWLNMFYDTLLELFIQSNNFKVRINACIALMSINLNDVTMVRDETITQYSETIYIKLWSCLIDAFSKLKNESIDANNELQHKNTLTFQLCKLLTYLCKYLRIIDLEKIMKKSLIDLKQNSLKKNSNLTLSELRSYLVNYIKEIYDKIETNKQEVQFYNEALTQLNLLKSNKKNSIDEDCIDLLNSILYKSVPKNNDESELSENESTTTETEIDNEYRKKFPFKNVYD